MNSTLATKVSTQKKLYEHHCHLHLKIHLTSSSLYHESASAKKNNKRILTLKISNAGSSFWCNLSLKF